MFQEEHKDERPSASQDVLPLMGRLVMADVKQEEEEEGTEEAEEDDLEEGGQDVEVCASLQQSWKEIQGKKGHGGRGWRKKSQQKMDHGKQWVMNNLLLVTTTVSVVSLSEVENAYRLACHKEGREPLTRFVLARLIHQQFPEAGKCRLGSRGNQKIHYSNLQFRGTISPKQYHLKATTSTASGNEAVGEMPSKGIPSAEIQGKCKKPVSSESPRSILQDPCPGKSTDESLRATKEAIVRAALQPLPEEEDEDEEGCENAAKRLAQVVKWVKSQGKWDVLLKTFAHSASCSRSPCCPLCLMFRRVRRHVVSARHACYVLRIYSVLLKLHVASCNNNNCGMTACPALRASRQMKRGRDDELQEEEAHQEQQQDEIQHITKRVNSQVNHPSSLSLRLPSTTSSLSGSEPSTPSPPGSPTHILPSSSRIAPLQPVRLRILDSKLSERGGA